MSQGRKQREGTTKPRLFWMMNKGRNGEDMRQKQTNPKIETWYKK